MLYANPLYPMVMHFHFEDRFCASKKSWIGRGGQVSAWGTIHMAAALAGYRMALVVSDCKDEGNTLN